MSHPAPEFFALQEAVAGRYSVERELGRGGMGAVFLARDAALDRPVAIKVLRLELADSPAQRERFVREARTAAKLSHPHIVPIHAVEEHDHVVFFVMSFIDGETLGARVTCAGALSQAEAVRVVQEVSWALGHAHVHGVVHRDIKPDNILLEHGTGREIVTDFGIAQLAEGSITASEPRVIGTPHYMSPEQASGGVVDARSDVYSLGVVAFFAVTGKLPIDGENAQVILAKQVVQPAAPVASLRRTLSPHVANAIDRCLAKEPARRFASADDLSRELTARNAGSTALAAPLRTFLREVDGAGLEVGTAFAASASSLLALGIEVARITLGPSSLFAGLSVSISSAIYVSIAAVTFSVGALRLGSVIARARDLIRLGYGHSAARAALVVQQEERVEESPRERPRRAWLLPAYLGGAVLSMWHYEDASSLLVLLGIAGSVLFPTLIAREVATRHTGGSWWTRLLGGRFGKALFRVAGIRLAAPAGRIAAAGEPTAVAVAHAATDLFAVLSAEQRAQFAELPTLVARLEASALELRSRSPSPSRDEKLTAVIAALDIIKLDLMRLGIEDSASHALTRDLEAATRIGDEIRALLDARGEVDRLLGAPRVSTGESI